MPRSSASSGASRPRADHLTRTNSAPCVSYDGGRRAPSGPSSRSDGGGGNRARVRRCAELEAPRRQREIAAGRCLAANVGRRAVKRPVSASGASSTAICGDSCRADLDAALPRPVGWLSTEHGVLAADDDASRRRQRSPATRWQDASASGQLVARPRWGQPTRCFFVPRRVRRERGGPGEVDVPRRRQQGALWLRATRWLVARSLGAHPLGLQRTIRGALLNTRAGLAALSRKRVLPMRLAVRHAGRERDGDAGAGASVAASDGYHELAGGLARLHVGVRLLDLVEIESTVHGHADLPACHGIEKVLKHGGR